MSTISFKATILSIIGLVGGFISTLFGGWTPSMETLVSFMVIDFAAGIILAAVFKKSPKTASGALSSSAGFKGVCKKIIILSMIYIAHRLDITMNVTFIMNSAVIAFIINELISIVEKAGLMGIKIPAVISKAIDLLNDKMEGVTK